MSTRTLTTVSIAGAVAFVAGWLAHDAVPVARAQDEAPADATSPARLCRTFSVDLDKPRAIETEDRTSEVGQWVAEQSGWAVHDIDFEVGQKATGYPQGWVQVCLAPAS